MIPITRRQFLLGSATAATSLLLWPSLTWAATGADARFVFVLLRGGLDGLEAVPPYGDPGYAALRGQRALSPSAAKPAHRLDNVFALHPSFAHAAELYARKQFMPIVAAAPPYWGRSHFQAQNCVENGTGKPDGAKSGWLNRCIAAMPGVDGLACATVMPLTMRGTVKADAWSPPLPKDVDPVLLRRLQPLYAADPGLASAFSRALAQPLALRVPATGPSLPQPGHGAPLLGVDSGLPVMGAGEKPRGGLPVVLAAAGDFMAGRNGPRIAFVEDDGWDTHEDQARILTNKIAELDAGLKNFHASIGDLWNRTIVVVATEFGRTAKVHTGDGGTDHGTGGSMFLAGGALRGGRIGGLWPGLGKGELFENRDLHATTDYRAVLKGVLAEHLGLSESVLESQIFPDSAKVVPVEGLVAKAPASA